VGVADGEAVGFRCRREVEVVVLAVGAAAACPASETTAEPGWPAAAPPVPAPFADVVLPGFGVALGLDDCVGVGVEVGDPVDDGDPVADGVALADGDTVGGPE